MLIQDFFRPVISIVFADMFDWYAHPAVHQYMFVSLFPKVLEEMVLTVELETEAAFQSRTLFSRCCPYHTQGPTF